MNETPVSTARERCQPGKFGGSPNAAYMPRRTYVTTGQIQSLGLNTPLGSSLSWGTLPDSRHTRTDSPTTADAATDCAVVRLANLRRREANTSTRKLAIAPTVAVAATHQTGNTDGNGGSCAMTGAQPQPALVG